MISPEPTDFLRELLKLVLRDGVFSKEERILIDNIARNVRKYENAVEDSIKDKIITKEEMELLVKIYNQIIDDATDTAQIDNFISPDEKAILDKLLEYLKQLSIKI